MRQADLPAVSKSLERYRREMRARSRHKNRYWNEHDRSAYGCPDCGRGDGEVHELHVHHIDRNPLNGDPENLIGLCRDCHYKRHGYDLPKSLDDWKESLNDLPNMNIDTTHESDTDPMLTEAY